MSSGKILDFPDRAAIDAEAAAWVARFDAGDVSASDQAAFQAWLNRSALHRDAVAEYGSFWSEFDALRHLTDTPKTALGTPTRIGSASRFRGLHYWLGACAAAVLVLVSAGGVVRQQGGERPSARQAAAPPASLRQSYSTAIGAQKKFTLADGTTVTLNTNSRIDVELTGHARQVHLVRGEAYFDVVHDPARPFTVHANQYVVRDIGTAFTVHLLKTSLVGVRVTKGSVEIAAPRRTGNLTHPAKSLGVIVAGQDIVFGQKIERAQSLSDEDLARKLAWRQGQLIYSGQPLAEVVADVSRYSDIEIEIANPALGNLPVGGAFRANQTDAIFAALENNFGVHAQWLDARHVRLTMADDRDATGN